MTISNIMKKRTGNCPCFYCGKVQPGWKMHPVTVWYKDLNEKHGHNIPVCSEECGMEWIKENLRK